MAKVIIDIPDVDYKDIVNDNPRNLNVYERMIKRGLKLPDNATNKEVFCSLFPIDWYREYGEEEWETFWNSQYEGKSSLVK